MPTPIYPSTSPAMARPLPRCPRLRVWTTATWPKMTARRDPSQNSQRMPNTSEAIAKPLVEDGVLDDAEEA